MTFSVRAAAIAAALGLAACGNAPKVPDWQVDAKSAADRFVDATLKGQTRVAQAEFAMARRETASTGRPDLVARIELLRCATQVASLNLDPCTGFEALREDAAAPEIAYADYLAGRDLTAQVVALLPPAQQGVAGRGRAQDEKEPQDGSMGQSPLNAERRLADTPDSNLMVSMTRIEDPLSRLVAAGVLLRRGAASPDVVQSAVDTASAQGWRRPLLAWLGVQARQADLSGQAEQARALRRRMDLVAGGEAGAKPVAPASEPASQRLP
jgi:hypothetical protein